MSETRASGWLWWAQGDLRAHSWPSPRYLTEEELAALDRIVSMYLDYAEDQARKRTPMTMADWAKKLAGFLAFNERNLLSHAGKVRHELAKQHAEAEFGNASSPTPRRPTSIG